MCENRDGSIEDIHECTEMAENNLHHGSDEFVEIWKHIAGDLQREVESFEASTQPHTQGNIQRQRHNHNHSAPALQRIAKLHGTADCPTSVRPHNGTSLCASTQAEHNHRR